jgi:cAMP phosphodiesterase
MQIRIFGAHASAAGTAGCVSLLVDDRVVLDACSVTALHLDEQCGLEAVLLSHQHLDHIRDLAPLALNLFRLGKHVEIHGTKTVLESLKNHIFNGEIFPCFQKIPVGNPTLDLREINPVKIDNICGYHVRAVPVNHGIGTVGFYLTDTSGNSMFYSADTGPGLGRCWQDISPQLLIIETSLPNRFRNYAEKTGHLTPAMLSGELVQFINTPRVVAIHLDPTLEAEIKSELEWVADSLDTTISVAYEGMEIVLHPSDARCPINR